MAKIFNGSIPIEQIFKFNQNAPLDDRVSVQYNSDLAGIKAYPGLMVYVNSEDKYYYYNKDGEWAVSTSAGGGDGLIDGTVLGTINGKEFAYKRSISLSSSDIGLDNQKIHIGHSNDGGQTLSNSGEWIGFYVGGDTPSSNPNDYAPWQKLSEGVGIEKMDDYFKIGTAASPQKPTVNSQGVVSDDWSPEPLEPTSQYQYLWAVVVTKFTNNTYSVSNPHIAGVKGLSALTGDLDNEMDSIPLNYQGYTTKQEVKSTRMTIFFGSTSQTLTQLIATSSQVEGISLTTDKDTGTVIVTIAPDTLIEENIDINITGTTLIGEITKTFTLAAVRASKDGDNAIIYQLQPSDNAIKVNSSLIYSTIYLTVTVNKIDGDVITAVDPNSEGHFLYYKVDDDAWTKYGSQISVGSAKKQVKLRLISVDTTNENFTGITYDRETIPVVIDGQNGTSITIKGKVQDSNHLPDPSGYQEGDAIITENDGHIWVIVNGQWVDCGQFQGLPGASSYVHIKYSIDGTRFTTNNGEDEGPWIGIYVDTNPEDSSNFTDYRWQKISGEDGSSQEFVFIRVDEWDGSESGKPVLTQSSGDDFQRDDYLPSNWTNPESHKVYQWEDDPVEATEDHPFIFYSQRKKISGIWQPFGNVLLWNRFTKDGDTTVLYQLVLSRDVIRPEDESKVINIKIVRSQGEYSENITTEDNFQLKYSIDGGELLTSTGISNATAGVNINIAAAEDYVNFYLYSDTNLLAQKSCNIITGAIGIQSIEEWYKATETDDPPSKDDDDWSNTITQITSELPYLWNYEICYSTEGGKLSETEITLIAIYSGDGRGIAEIQEYYQISDQSVNPPIRWTGDTTPTARVSDDTEKTILNTWKANADLTTHEKPYLWNFAVIQYSKSPFFEYEVPQCIGVQGASPLIMDLDNEMDSFIVDEDNKYEGENLQLETGVEVYLGRNSQPLTALVATPQSGSGVASSDIVSDRTNKKVTVTIKKNQVYSKKIEITITATTDSGVLSKVFTIVPVPGGENAVIYKIYPAYDVIKVDKNGSRIPASTITSQITKITGKSGSETANSFSGVTLKYSIDGGNYNNYNPSSPPSSTSINQNIKFRLLDSNSTVLDQETIPVVYDGSDGNSVLFADLDNEMDCIITDANGVLSTAKVFQINGRMWLGTQQQVITNVVKVGNSTGTVQLTSVDENDGTGHISITIPTGTYTDSYSITLNLTCEIGSIERTFTVGVAKGGKNAVVYNLLPSVDSIKRTNQGVYQTPSDGKIVILITKSVGDNISNIQSESGKYIQYSVDNSTTWYAYSSEININSLSPQKNIRLRLINQGSTVETPNGAIYYDKETIPVISDGADSTRIVGDLDNEMAGFALDSNGWSSDEVTLSAETTLSVFEGTTPVTITNCTVTNPMSGFCTITKTPLENSTKYKIKIDLAQDDDYNEFLNSPVNFIITGTGEGWSVSRVFSVCFYKSGESAKFYQLQTSSSTIKKTIDEEFEEPLTVSAIKVEGKQFTSVTTGVHCYYSLDNSSTWTKLTLSNTTPVNLLDNNNPQYNIRFRLQDVENNSDYGSNGFIQGVKIYDKETIPVIVDGKNAKQYSLVASRKDFNRDDPVTVCSYVSDGEEETPFAGYFVVVEKDFDGEAVNTTKISSQSSKIEDWLPSGDITYKVQFYLFKSRVEVTNFNPDSSIPLAQCELLAQQSTAELDLGGLDGTQNYLVSSENKITETQIFNINCKFYINSIENPCSITVTPKETYTVGMLYDTANSSGTHLQFIANISSTAVSGSQIYTIEATATYCGITYTRQKEVIFTPVAAGASIQGANGCIVRYRGNWGDITNYPTVESPARVVLFDCESSHTDAGTFETSPRFKYIDVVRYSGKYYRCNTKHKITLNSQFNANLQTPKYIPGQNYQGQSYWTEANEFDFIVTDTLIAEYVSSQTISAKDVIITERNANNEVTNIVGGMTSSSATVEGNNLNLGSVRIWAGTTSLDPNIQDAPFRVTQSGQLTAKNANISGNITATDFRLVSGNEIVLHLSTFGNLKTQFPNTTVENPEYSSYDDTLPIFALKDQNGKWYFLPVVEIVPNVPSGSTSVLNEVKGFLLNTSLTANKLVDSSQNSINPTDNVCKLCSSTDTSLNNKYYKLSATSPTTANLYTGDFVGNGLIKKETITINRGGYTADVTIRTRPVLIITNGIAAQRYVYVGPKVTWSSSGYAVDWSTRWFWKPFSAKSDGYHPDFSTEVSATYSEDFLGIYDSITTSNNNPSPLD